MRIRQKFNLEEGSSDQYVLHEYQCALMHADGSSKGKLYITSGFLCFAGSLFGRDTRAVYPVAEIIALEKTESPAPNSILITSASTEERFTFFSTRGHAYALINQLLAISRLDHTLAASHELPTQVSELPPEPFLEKAKLPPKPDVTLPLALSKIMPRRRNVLALPNTNAARDGLPRDCSNTAALSAAQFTAMWPRVAARADKRRAKEAHGASAPAATTTYARVDGDGTMVPLSFSKDKESVLAAGELTDEQVIDFHDLPSTATRWGLQLRLPGYDWSGTIIVDVQAPSERTETVRLRPIASGAKALRVQLRHRASCARSRHLLQVYVSYWLVNGTGLTLQFKRRKQLTVAADEPTAPSAAAVHDNEGW